MQKIKKTFHKIFGLKYVYFLILLILCTLVYFYDYKSKMFNLGVDYYLKLKSFIILTLIIVVIGFIAICCTKRLFKEEKNIWKGYLVLSLIFGSLYLFVIPMYSQSDEIAHYYRAYEVANNHFLPTYKEGKIYNEFPSSLEETINIYSGDAIHKKKYSDAKDMLIIELNKEDTKEISSYAGYVPFSYFPQFIGMKLGIAFNMSPYLIGMLGRLSSLIFCSVIIAIGIKLLPFKKLFAALIFLTPVCLSYFASISADGSITCISFLFIAIILNYIKEKKKIDWSHFLLLLFLSIIISVCKSVYFPIIFALSFIPKECFKNFKHKWLGIIFIVIISMTCVLEWSSLANTVNTTEVAYNNTAHWILKNPIQYSVILIRALMYNGYDFLTNMVASNFIAHNQASIYSIIPIILLALIVISYFNDDSFIKKNDYIKIGYTLCTLLIVYALIATSMYVYNTACANYDGYPFIIGIQGRYFLPLIGLLLFLPSKKIFNSKKYAFFDIFIVMNIMVLLSLVITFII